MRRIIKYFDLQHVKEDSRKIGINLVSAGFVGAFITHVLQFTLTGLVMLAGMELLGLSLMLAGLKRD